MEWTAGGNEKCSSPLRMKEAVCRLCIHRKTDFVLDYYFSRRFSAGHSVGFVRKQIIIRHFGLSSVGTRHSPHSTATPCFELMWFIFGTGGCLDTKGKRELFLEIAALFHLLFVVIITKQTLFIWNLWHLDAWLRFKKKTQWPNHLEKQTLHIA